MVVSFIIYRWRQNRKLYYFSLVWTILWIAITSFAIPSTDTVLRQNTYGTPGGTNTMLFGTMPFI